MSPETSRKGSARPTGYNARTADLQISGERGTKTSYFRSPSVLDNGPSLIRILVNHTPTLLRLNCDKKCVCLSVSHGRDSIETRKDCSVSLTFVMTSYPVQQLVGGRAIESHRESIPPSPAAMGGVVAAAMDGAEIGRVIGTAVAFGHQTVVGVGAGLAADVADAAIADDH